MSKIRLGIIGAGGIAREHAKRMLQRGDVEIAALTEPSEDSLAGFAEAVYDGAPLPPVYAEYTEMLEAETLDAALIASPHTVHFAQIMDCLDAGLHVLAEKPMVCSTGETQAVIARAAQGGRHIVVSYQRRFEAVFRYMRRFIRSAGFGQAMFVSSFLSQGWLTGQVGKWRQDPALSGGGQLNDSGSHIIDMVAWMLPDEIVEVTALIDNRDTAVDIDSAVAYRTSGGTLGTLSIVGSGPEGVFWEDMTVTGETGRSLFLRKGVLQTMDAHGEDLAVVDDFSDVENTTPDDHFVDVIAGGAENLSPPEDFLKVIRFTEACWASAAEGGKPVRVG